MSLNTSTAHLNSHGHPNNPEWKHIPTYSRILPGWYMKAYCLMYRLHLFRQRQHLVPSPLTRSSSTSSCEHYDSSAELLRYTIFISCTWWLYCIPPHCSEIVRWAFMIYEHNSIPVTDTIKGGRINFQKTNFNQNKKIVDH